MRKVLNKTMLIIILSICIITLNGSSLEKEMQILAEAYGYIMGQNMMLEKIKDNYPDLKVNVIQAEFKFKSSFRKSEENIEIKLKELMGEYYNEFMNNYKIEIRKMFVDIEYNREESLSFLEEVKQRAEGNIESPIKEVLLTYQYIDRPENEIIDGYVKKYRSKGHKKAKGVEIVIKVPYSWKGMQGDRPNIVQKFKHKNGEGLTGFILLIKNIPQEELAFIRKNGSEEYYNQVDNESVKQMNSKLIHREIVKIDRYQWSKIVTETKEKGIGFPVNIISLIYTTIVQDELVQMTFSVANFTDEENLWDEYDKYKMLFDMIAYSIVLPEQYIDN